MAREVAQLEVGYGQPDDRGFVELGGYRSRQGQHLRQLVELEVLLAAARPRRVPALLLPQLEDAVTRQRNTATIIQVL